MVAFDESSLSRKLSLTENKTVYEYALKITPKIPSMRNVENLSWNEMMTSTTDIINKVIVKNNIGAIF
jgi:hypothetical protein